MKRVVYKTSDDKNSKKTPQVPLWFAGPFWIIFICFFIYMCTECEPDDRSVPTKSTEPCPCISSYSVESNYQMLVDNGLITGRGTEDRAVFNVSMLWYSLGVSEKEKVLSILACYYCYNQSNSNTARCIVRDNRSGKTLAKYGAFGSKFY